MNSNAQFSQEIRARKSLEIDHRLAHGPVFTPTEIIYSASMRCPCGAGLAYPVGSGPHGYWTCSMVLLGDAGTRHASLSQVGLRRYFSEWDIAAETDPVACGSTTRAPNFQPDPQNGAGAQRLSATEA